MATAACKKPQSAPQVLKVVDVVSGQFVVHNDNLRSIISKLDHSVEVAVLSIAGEYRKGKSFLLNFVLQYLKFRETNAADKPINSAAVLQQMIRQGSHPWLQNIQRSTGFHFQAGRVRDTTGINMWSKPFVIKKSDGKRMAVIVMDSQGLYDPKTSSNDNVRLFTMAALLSSSLMLNTSHNINMLQLMELKLFTEYAKTGSRLSEGSKPFQRLTFLIRDYTLGSCGWDGGKEECNQFMQPDAEQAEEVRELSLTLSKGFALIDAFALPFPGGEVTKADFDGSLKKVDPEFLYHLENFVIDITDKLQPRAPLILSLTAGELQRYVDNIVRVFNNQLPPNELMQMNERLIVTKARDAMQELLRHYEDQLRETIERQPNSYFSQRTLPQIADEIKRKHETASSEVYLCFEKMPFSNLNIDRSSDGRLETAAQILKRQISETYMTIQPQLMQNASDKKQAVVENQRREAAMREERERIERERQRQEDERQELAWQRRLMERDRQRMKYEREEEKRERQERKQRKWQEKEREAQNMRQLEESRKREAEEAKVREAELQKQVEEEKQRVQRLEDQANFFKLPSGGRRRSF